MGRLFDLVEAHREAHQPYPPSYSRIAEQVGVSRQTLLNWKTPTELIDKDSLIALGRVTGNTYASVRDALLADIGYLNETDRPVKKAARRGGLTQAERESAVAEGRRRRASHKGDDPVADDETA
jgi:hypothetical protein